MLYWASKLFGTFVTEEAEDRAFFTIYAEERTGGLQQKKSKKEKLPFQNPNMRENEMSDELYRGWITC